MPTPLTVAMDLDRRLEENIASINDRIRSLDEQMRLADEIIADMVVDPWRYGIPDDDDDFSHYSIPSSDDESDAETVLYRTSYDNIFFDDEDEDDQSDVETVVGDWVDPYITPDRAFRGIVMPEDLEAGLEFLN